MERNRKEITPEEARKRSRRGLIMIILGLLMIAGALGLTAYNIWDGNRAEKAAKEIADVLIEKIDIDDSTPQFPVLETEIPMPTETINGVEYIGILEIPDMDLTLPVSMEWDYNLLEICACRFMGSYYTDDLVICAHNYAKFFSPIKWIDIGADVYFTNVEGMTIHYMVTNRETVQPTSVDQMTQNIHNSDTSMLDWDMTLFTCNTGGQTRCAVRCSRVE